MPSPERSIQPPPSAQIGAVAIFETVGEIADGVIVRGDRAKPVKRAVDGDRLSANGRTSTSQ